MWVGKRLISASWSGQLAELGNDKIPERKYLVMVSRVLLLLVIKPVRKIIIFFSDIINKSVHKYDQNIWFRILKS